MNFIETLKSVGGVKPCWACKGRGEIDSVHKDEPGLYCHTCHGTGQILDLALLMANPEKLYECVLAFDNTFAIRRNIGERMIGVSAKLIIVGPQRASNLVYEVARQLGGTTVIATSYTVIGDGESALDGDYDEYRLSLPIPDNTTVLFVTDKVDEQEMMEIMQVTSSQPANALPYVLALVSSSDVWLNDPEGDKTNTWKIISLHQE